VFALASNPASLRIPRDSRFERHGAGGALAGGWTATTSRSREPSRALGRRHLGSLVDATALLTRATSRRRPGGEHGYYHSRALSNSRERPGAETRSRPVLKEPVEVTVGHGRVAIVRRTRRSGNRRFEAGASGGSQKGRWQRGEQAL